MDTALRTSPRERTELAPDGLIEVGMISGLLGGLALAVPIVIWDWVRDGHRALELPMAATAWTFGLVHFSHDENLWWPIVLGIALLGVYWAATGIVFASLAERFGLERPLSTVAAGAMTSFTSFLLFWYVLLPIARDGAPFRAPALDPVLYTAPNWVWILGFTLSGLVIAGSYAALRRSPVFRGARRAGRVEEPHPRLRHAA